MPKLPVILVGSGWTGWHPRHSTGSRSRPCRPNPWAAGAACRVCGGRHLTPAEACLGCLKSGVDDRLPAVQARMRPRASRSPAAPKALAGGKGRRPKS